MQVLRNITLPNQLLLTITSSPQQFRLFWAASIILFLVMAHSCSAETPKSEVVSQLQLSQENKVRFLVLNELQQFREKLREIDENDIFDHRIYENDITQLDTIIFFVNGWDEVSRIDPIFDQVKKELAGTKNNMINHIQIRELIHDNEIRRIVLMFYNTAPIKDKPVECFAKDVLSYFTLDSKTYEKMKFLTTCNSG